jgi:hypothetical protein
MAGSCELVDEPSAARGGERFLAQMSNNIFRKLRSIQLLKILECSRFFVVVDNVAYICHRMEE